MQAVSRLIEIMKALRDPRTGCPWDRKQTLLSIVPWTLEEVYELADAVERDDPAGLREELGDLLFHIAFYAQIACESGSFSFNDIAEDINAKLERRHPHVFGDAAVSGAAEQAREWERHKTRERGGRSPRFLDGISASLPALIRAGKLQRRAAVVGFDWEKAEDVLGKLEEEVAELRASLQRGAPTAELAGELGDVLFAAINSARHLDVDPELALRATNRKFEERFAYVEAELKARGRSLEEATLEEMEALWQAAKNAEIHRRAR